MLQTSDLNVNSRRLCDTILSSYSSSDDSDPYVFHTYGKSETGPIRGQTM